MGRGYWTYHKTFEAGCCGPCCIMGLLMIPVIPLIGGYHAIRDAGSGNRQSHSTAGAEADTETTEDLDGIVLPN